MSDIPSVKLNSGYNFPLIGFGTFGGNDAPEQVYHASKIALKAGYKHFDTAYSYQTEDSLAKAIKESGIPREELFITTKLWQNFHEPQHVGPVFERSLKNLETDYVDLYLMHFPMSWKFTGYEYEDFKDLENPEVTNVPIIDTWRAMEQLVKSGKARSIGVSNFTIPMLEELLSQCEIPPAVNQVELHPYLPQEDLVEYCKKKNIVLTAYSPLGNPGYRNNMINIFDHPTVLKLAEKYNKTPVQVILNYGINRGYAVIPKYNLVINDIGSSEEAPLKAIKLLASFLSDKQKNVDEHVQKAMALLEEGSNRINSVVQVVIASILVQAGRFEDALRVLHSRQKKLECSALAVQIYLQLDRLDLARNEVASVKSWAEDALLLQLMEAWVDLRIVKVITRYTSQLREVAPQHPYLQELDLKSSLFDRCASRYALVDSA
ncbi:hypothetical protein RMCBS344292_15918 [Rhizopus microsporus]|nr:hypothetical protein RMCBS344292_15918 [Rhizopus microsporus]